jgi:signal transduction histidine kinase
MKNPELADLLRAHQDEIASNWTAKIQEMSTLHYQQYSHKLLRAWASQSLVEIINAFSSGSVQDLEEFIDQVVSTGIQAGFPLSEITAGFLLVKEASLPVVWAAFSTNSRKLTEVISQIDQLLRQLITRFTHQFSESLQKQLFMEAHLRLAESESLQKTTRGLLEKLNLDEVLEIVSIEACQLTGATGCAVLLLEDQDWLNVTISTGHPLRVLDRLPVTDSLEGKAVQESIPQIINDFEEQLQADQHHPDIESILVVPLSAKETIIGVLDVVNKPGGFKEDDLRIMHIFAAQAAIAIENARLRKQAQKLAVMEERQRLARDLHDSVTQALYSLKLYADATQLALSAGKTSVASENLVELSNMAREAMLDMRLLIFELHPPILEKEGLVTALKTRLEAVEARSGIQTRFEVVGECRLPLAIETELYRLAQEALTNAVKHAKAQQVSIWMNCDEQQICLEVSDDGVGFDTQSISQSGGLGIQGMMERVKQLDGELTIDSAPGKGTSVRVSLDI